MEVMLKTINELIEDKKINTKEDFERINFIKELCSNPKWMFEVPLEVVLTILDYLDIPEDKIDDYYCELISVNNYIK